MISPQGYTNNNYNNDESPHYRHLALSKLPLEPTTFTIATAIEAP